SDLEAALRTLAGAATLDRFSKLVTMLKRDRDRWHQTRTAGAASHAARRRLLGVTAADRAAVIANAVSGADETALRAAARIIAVKGAATTKQKASAILDW